MKTIIGPFHPDLEEALVQEIQSYKEADLLAPLLILVPSDLLRRRLKIVLTRERRLALLNVHILTFFQLSLRLNEESGASEQEPSQELFLEEALRRIIRNQQPGAESYAGIENRAGGCAALWQTLRDLRDGVVDPALALEALQEKQLQWQASERTSELLRLFQTFQDFCREKDVLAQSDLDRRGTEHVARSEFLKTFAQIFYYGFYDLTQIQLDFFQTVARYFATTLFFPLLPAQPRHEAWTFATRFYQRYVQGQSFESPSSETGGPLPATARLFDEYAQRAYHEIPNSWQCSITSAFGLRDEIAAAAKEILKLNEQHRVPFHEIAVVARSLEEYGCLTKDTFEQHCIPVAGRFERPLIQDPLAKAVNLLIDLPSKDFARSQVIDLLSSPHVQFEAIVGRTIKARPDYWDLASRELAISKGIHEWRRLRRYSGGGVRLAQISDDDDPRFLHIPAGQIALLAEIVETLVADLSRVPEQASWGELCAAWEELLKKYLGITRGAELPGRNASPQAAIVEILRQLAALDALEKNVTLGEFGHTFAHWMERWRISEDARNRDGVMVLDAGEARGLSFRALFVLGMNEGVFPRTIREDAFLRDSDREVIERDLGYKINAKLPAFDEEKLLFTLLVGAARERLYCSYQRADESGRVLSSSWYVDELQRALHACGREIAITHIPRSALEKNAIAPFDREDLLRPIELGVNVTLQGGDPTALVEAAALLPEIYQNGRSAIEQLEHGSARLLPFDGMLSDIQQHWSRLLKRGSAPTALEAYARCPFQFFSRHVLGLEPLDWPEEALGPTPAEFGQLGHAILDRFYQDLITRGYFTSKRSRIDIDTCLRAAAGRVFTEYQDENPVGYPLFWEHLKETLLQTLRRVIEQDLTELARSGFEPISLETNVTGSLPEDWPEPLKNFRIRGRMDRIDRAGGDAGGLRVIDYKFKLGANPKTEDNNLVLGALRGARLQPPMYLLLAEEWARARGMPANLDIKADFYYIAPNWTKGPLDTRSYASGDLAGHAGAETKATIAYLAEGVRTGRFFLNRGDHCAFCDVARICRKNHLPSAWRAENDPLTEVHRELRKRFEENARGLRKSPLTPLFQRGASEFPPLKKKGD